VKAPGELGNTPLHEAVGQGHVRAINLLLAHGASPNAKNEFGETPLDIARLKKREDIAKLLQDRMDNPAKDGE
jgi:ankyrin repeat protein